MGIGDNVRLLRENKQLQQAELAAQLGITQSMLSQIERGTKALSLALAVDIAKTLGSNLEQIAFGIDRRASCAAKEV